MPEPRHFSTVQVRIQRDPDLDVCAEVHEEEEAEVVRQWTAPTDLIQALQRVHRDPGATYHICRDGKGYTVKKAMDRAAVLQLQSGDVHHVRLTRLYMPSPVVQYDGPATLYVQRGPAPRRGKEQRFLVTPQQSATVPAWAEYSNEGIDRDGQCIVEDYLMEIFEEA